MQTPMSTPAPIRPEPRLLADIGVTSARLCIEAAPEHFEQIAVLRCADHAGFVEVVEAYLAGIDGPRPRHAAVAIANPIEGDQVRMTNRDWSFSIRDAQQRLGLATLLVVNDFTAIAKSLPRIGPDGRRAVGGGTPQPEGIIGLIGPGTGMGISGLVPVGRRWTTLATEGGHASFAPADERELRVLRHAWSRYRHVSLERIVSAPGLQLIHEALADGADPLPVEEIVRRALAGEDPACIEALECFCCTLGTAASDLALTLGAVGGIYIAGGIVPRLGSFFDRSGFRARFESKGRFSDYVARIPTYVLTEAHPAFYGTSALLAEHLPEAAVGNPLIERIRAARDGLSPAERRVADFVLENPRAALNDAVAVIAQMAEVSQPTVIRFCRTLGFQGLADFKLKLGSGLTGSLPMQRSAVRREDRTADLCAKVLDNTIQAIAEFRESLNVDAVEQAIELLRQARRVELYAIGDSTTVAADAQRKLFRFRIPSVLQADPTAHVLAADLLGAGDVALFVSRSGEPPDLVRAATHARRRGAQVIAITAGQSTLARRASVCITVEHSEDASTFVAMISRILHLMVVDMLATGVAVRERRDAPESVQAPADGGLGEQRLTAPGVLVSHLGSG